MVQAAQNARRTDKEWSENLAIKLAAAEAALASNASQQPAQDTTQQLQLLDQCLKVILYESRGYGLIVTQVF